MILKNYLNILNDNKTYSSFSHKPTQFYNQKWDSEAYIGPTHSQSFITMYTY